MPAKPEGLDADCIAVRSGGCSGIRLDILRISDCRRSDIDWERFEAETAVLAAESSVIALRIEASKSSMPGSGAFCAWLIEIDLPRRESRAPPGLKIAQTDHTRK
jgi:hypothetical protein